MKKIADLVPAPAPTPEPTDEVPKRPVRKPKKQEKQLSVKLNVLEVSIAPKELEVYAKSTQTMFEESYIESGVGTSTGTEHSMGETSLKRSKVLDDDLDRAIATETVYEETPIAPELSQPEKEIIIQSQDFQGWLDSSSKIIERAINVGSKFDIFVDYGITEAPKAFNKREVSLEIKFSDERWTKHRSVTDVGWSAKQSDLVVASYSANETGSNDPDGVVLVWSLQNTLNRPEYRFNCQSPVMTAFFSPFSPTIVVGGTYSGQIVLWDIRAKSTPVQQTPLSAIGHTHPVYSMNLVGTKNAHNLVTVSTDGKLCVWSLENLLQPQEVLELHNKQSKPMAATGAAVAATAIEFPEGEVNGFLVGSEEGAVYQAFRHGSKTGVHERFDGHHGPITGLSFHPPTGQIGFPDLFLSSSTDWTCKLWNQKSSTQPLYSFEDAGDYIYDVKWCPTHPAIFATVDGTGCLDLWNLNEETEVPIIKTNVGNKALNRLKWSPDGKKILTGDSAGTLFVYDTGEISIPRSDEWHKFEETLSIMSQSLDQSASTVSV
eukprot:TRINITY_DN9079_c0_g1_i1.p1 TRINITY_DN9079_c0_g1~~TRINITY_DN9079_c0_g1_i1.p1  ORF type:complete len:618 (-),score=163.43 TRINITY_DN9079_c0_g1_i1:23-1660(-)